MKSQGLAVAVALAGAFLFALAAALQQRAASSIPDAEATGGKIMKALVRKPMWWAGFGSDTAGYVAQAVALAVGSLLIVQPLLVTTLLFALPLGRWLTGRRIYPSDWGWAIALTVALGVFIDVGRPTDGVDSAPLTRWLVPLAVIGVGSAVAVAASTRRRGRVRSLLLAAPTGALFGLGSALTKSVVDAFDDPASAVPELLTSWETYALGVALAAGFWLQQSAYQAGNLKEALPAMITLDPVVSVAIGIVVLQERLRVVDAIGWAVVVATLVVMVVGTIQLSRSSALHDPPIA